MGWHSKHLRLEHSRLAAHRFVAPLRDVFTRSREGKSWPRWHDTGSMAIAYFLALLRPGKRKNMHGIGVRMGLSEDKVERFIRDSPWEHEALQDHLITHVPETIRSPRAAFVIDDFGIVKQGRHSVGVDRQYSGTMGKVGNCQVAVNLVYASPGQRRNADQRTWPLGIRLYLPKEWTEDEERRTEVGVPDGVSFRTKPEIALEMMDRVLSHGLEHLFIVGDAGYGDSSAFRKALRERGEPYVLGVNPGNIRVIDPTVPIAPLKGSAVNAARLEVGRYPEGVRAASAAEMADGVVEWTKVRWSQGTKGALTGRFHRVLVRVTTDWVEDRKATDEVAWLLLERRDDELKAYVCWGMDDATLKELVARAHLRWVVEQFHKEAKQLLGMDRFEGRSWRGWNHHISMVLLAYAFLSMLRAEGTTGPLPSLRATVVAVVQEALIQDLMRKHRLKRHQASTIATTVRRGYTDWY
jgi:SRSO17 transposase